MRSFLVTILLFTTLLSNAQNAVFKVTHDYFRTNPFAGAYSNFVKSLISDPSLDTQKLSKKTDTTFFFFTGRYKNYNPFFFKPLYTEVVLAESEIPDSTGDINYVYQLVAHAKNDKAGLKDITSEFEKLNRRYGKGFINDQLRVIKKEETTDGAIHDYKIDGTAYVPLTLAWANKKQSGEVILVITIRFMVEDNTCFLPKSFK